jgi:hypothetical protein
MADYDCVLLVCREFWFLQAGLYSDAYYRHAADTDTPKGLRMVAEMPDHNVSVVGTNDGEAWFVLFGYADVARAGTPRQLFLDFSQQGRGCAEQHSVPGCNYTASFADAEIAFENTGDSCATVLQGQWRWVRLGSSTGELCGESLVAR